MCSDSFIHPLPDNTDANHLRFIKSHICRAETLASGRQPTKMRSPGLGERPLAAAFLRDQVSNSREVPVIGENVDREPMLSTGPRLSLQFGSYARLFDFVPLEIADAS
jgi:hypothetical protein